MTEEKTAKKAVPKKTVKLDAKSDVFAVIKTGGKQYIVRVGKQYDFEKLDIEEGKEITFEEVLLIVNDKDVKIGEPHVAGVKVTGKVIAQTKDDKVRVFKYKAKKRYRKTQGHRQQKTRVEITKIG